MEEDNILTNLLDPSTVSEQEQSMETKTIPEEVEKEVVTESAETSVPEGAETEPADDNPMESETSGEEQEDDGDEEQQMNLPNDVEVLKEMVTSLTAKVEELKKLFQDKISYCEYEQKIVNDMHTELQKYKQDMNFQIIKPILMDVIDMRNSMLMNAKLCRNKPESEQVIPLDTFLTYAEGDAENILIVNDITIYEANIGDVFNPAKERVVKKIKTSDSDLHGKIADVMGSGYEYNGKVLSPQKVAVYIYEKPEEPEEPVIKE